VSVSMRLDCEPEHDAVGGIGAGVDVSADVSASVSVRYTEQ
jgi:hypothetical protein